MKPDKVNEHNFNQEEDYLVVGDGHHHNTGLQRDDLVESLDVGSSSVISNGDNLGISKLHAEAGSDLAQALDELLGDGAIPDGEELIREATT